MQFTYRVGTQAPINLLALSNDHEESDPCDSLENVSSPEADEMFPLDHDNPRVTKFRVRGIDVSVNLETGYATFDGNIGQEIHISFDRVNLNRRRRA